MTTKKYTTGLLFAITVAISTSALSLAGYYFLNNANIEGGSNRRAVIESREKELSFVEIKNLIVTLKDTSGIERYLLLELAFITREPTAAKMLTELSPVIRGTTVNLLTGMTYNDVRLMSVATLRDKLNSAYREQFRSLNNNISFDEVIISKMVFQ